MMYSQTGSASGRAASSPSGTTARQRVVIVSFADVLLLDLAGPAQVFGAAAGACPGAYEIVMVSMLGGPVATDLGVSVATVPCGSLVPLPSDTLVVLGGLGAWAAVADTAFLYWVRTFAAGAGRVASVCLGAIILAAAGLLEGRRATTHWRYCDHLQRTFPGVRVDRDPIFVRDGTVWTSAGVTAGIDLALAMVEEDLGHAAAMDVARRLVVFLKRPGGQAQFSTMLLAQSHGLDGRFAELHSWIVDNIAADLQVERLADRAGMTPRTFTRSFTRHTGLTPAKTVEALRVEMARGLLEAGQAPVGVIARQCGFGDDERMRRAFLRLLGASPADYRARFGASCRRPGAAAAE